MKKINLLILLAVCFVSLFISNLQGQTFSFTRISDPVVYSNDTSGIISHARVNNLTSGNNQLRLIRTVTNAPPGWESCICDIVMCHPPGTDTAIANYPPGISFVDLIIYTHDFSGRGYVTIRAEKVSNTNENYSVIFGGEYNPIGIHRISTTAGEFRLSQNYPNPFNPSTKISFSIPKNDFVSLRVYDILGREVKTILNENLIQGEYEIDFNADAVPSGIYFYSLRAGSFTESKKMLLIK